MLKKPILIYSLLGFTVLQSGCFTAYQAANTGNKTPVYLHVAKTEDYTFYVNGEKVIPEYMEYSVDKITQTSSSITVRTTSLPALPVKANKPYVSLRIVNDHTGQQYQYLLKSDLMVGAKWIMCFQGMCTMGIGNAVDLATSSVYAWPIL